MRCAERTTACCANYHELAVFRLDDRSHRDDPRESRSAVSPRTTIHLRPTNCVRSGLTRRRLARAIDAVLAVTGHHVLLEDNPVLRRSIDVRNPYVDPINLVQVELLRRLREADADASLFDAFVVTVNGIAAGMRNTG